MRVAVSLPQNTCKAEVSVLGTSRPFNIYFWIKVTYRTKWLELQIGFGIQRKIYHSEILRSICFQKNSNNLKMSLTLLKKKFIKGVGINDELVNIFLVKCTKVNFYIIA